MPYSFHEISFEAILLRLPKKKTFGQRCHTSSGVILRYEVRYTGATLWTVTLTSCYDVLQWHHVMSRYTGVNLFVTMRRSFMSLRHYVMRYVRTCPCYEICCNDWMCTVLLVIRPCCDACYKILQCHLCMLQPKVLYVVSCCGVLRKLNGGFSD